jgi:hypothetical protein
MAFSVGLAIFYLELISLKWKKRPAKRIAKKEASKFDNNEAELIDLIAQLIVEIIIDDDENDKDLVPEI